MPLVCMFGLHEGCDTWTDWSLDVLFKLMFGRATCLQTTSLFLIPIIVIEKAEVIMNLDSIFVVATWSCIFLVPAILKRFTGSISSTIFELFICNYLGTSASLRSLPTDNNTNKLKSKQLNYYSLEIHSRTAYPFPHPPTLSTTTLLINPPPFHIQKANSFRLV